MPAALLVLLAALAGVFGAPAAASDGPATARSVVREPAPQRLVAPTRSTAAVRAGISAAVHGLATRAGTTGSGPVPTAAVPGALLLLALALLGRAAVGGGGWSLPRRTPGSHRGRAPPAYALALG